LNKTLLYGRAAVQFPAVNAGTGKIFPGPGREKGRFPKRKGSALEGPVFIYPAAFLPENTVKVGLFL
jgi:hypothetical protein